MSFVIAMLVISAGAIYQLEFAQHYPTRAKLFPLSIAIVMLGLSLFELVLSGLPLLTRLRAGAMPVPETGAITDADAEEALRGDADDLSSLGLRSRVMACLQFAGFFLTLWLLGFAVAVPIFVAGYLYLAGRIRLPMAILVAIATVVLMHLVFVELVPIPMGQGVLLQVAL
jgi:hypothetical protein